MNLGQGSGVKGQGYRQLLAWQRAHELALAVFRVTQSLPPAQAWLRSQCSRAAVSVPANIAEGYSRGSAREYVYFLNVARGSLAEVEYYLLFMRGSGLLDCGTTEELEAVQRDAAGLLFGLIRALQSQDSRRPRSAARTGDLRALYDTATDDPALTLDPVTLDPNAEVP